ncbi:hypothetical protein ECG_05239 [Echinococcus granulosus]|uniref:Expressed conserved protein n=3 Tax=Echinococcus TaxID=6209 RepID=A0A068WKE2_ECHGR|nr:hypothetical protein ECG_05239 [Echinococcus granulosus]CDS18143.1 expressed conserved protein [Echinococcus granulosus]CUT98848.1 expressed conserved protein [Echinococcus multilocularis]
MISEALAAVAVAVNFTANIYGKRPFYAKLYRTIPSALLMYAFGRVIERILLHRKRTRLLAIEHYKSMFPERVPKQVETYYADVIAPWTPRR